MRVGPFWRKVPSTATTCMTEWRQCFMWLDQHGDVYAIEWI